MGVSTHIKQQPILEHNLEAAKFVFYQNMAVVEGIEGTHVTFEKVSNVLRVAEEVYGNDIPFVYISHRIHSYSIDPIGYYEAIKSFHNLKALAIVTSSKRTKMIANLEKLFVAKPIRVFDDLDSAILWAEEIIEKIN